MVKMHIQRLLGKKMIKLISSAPFMICQPKKLLEGNENSFRILKYLTIPIHKNIDERCYFRPNAEERSSGSNGNRCVHFGLICASIVGYTMGNAFVLTSASPPAVCGEDG